MTPGDAVIRISQLGRALNCADLHNITRINISDEVDSIGPHQIADVVPNALMLNGNLMTARDIPALLHFRALQMIVAHRIGFAGALLNEVSIFRELRVIAMSDTAVTDKDVLSLQNSPRLVSIGLARTQITDAAMATFATLPDLELLDVCDTQISLHGLQSFRHHHNLLSVNVKGTRVTAKDAEQFRSQVANLLPDLEVRV